MRKEASRGYCMGLGFTVWCIHSKHWECASSHVHPCALARKATRREAGAQSLRTSIEVAGSLAVRLWRETLVSTISMARESSLSTPKEGA
jgi:hypothetical protein